MKRESTLDCLLTPEDVARYLAVSVGTLNVWRATHRYPLPFVRVGRRVRYRREAVEQFLAERTTAPAA